MIIHFSSLSSFIDDGCPAWFEERTQTLGLLGSLANDRSSIDKVLDGEVKCCRALMWDSGAISVRNNKTDITLEKYVEWVKGIHHSDIPTIIIALDVIGDAEASQKNYLRLKYDYGFGNNFLPVYHYGEPVHYLEFLVKEGFDYIGLGGVGAGDRLGQDGLKDWLRSVFFTNSDGKNLRYPGVKFHGFAITSEKTMMQFPFYSVDSATWVKNSAVGKILTPFGDWRISEHAESGGDPYHFLRAAPKTQEKIVNWINTLGFTLDQVIHGRYEKHIVNINYFREIERRHNWMPAKVETPSMYSVLKDMENAGQIAKPRLKLKVSLNGIGEEKPIEHAPGCVDFVVEEPVQERSVVEVRPTPVSEKKTLGTALVNIIQCPCCHKDILLETSARAGKVED